MTERARAYIRVSRPTDEEMEILKHQREAVLQYCKDQDLELVHEVYEEVASGGDPKRIAFNDLLHDVRKGEVVIFTSMSRMTRGGIGAAWDLLRRLKQFGVGWRFVEQPILDYDSKNQKV